MTNRDTFNYLKTIYPKLAYYKTHRFLDFNTSIYNLENSLMYAKQIYNVIGKKWNDKAIESLLSFEFDWDNPILTKTIYNVVKFIKDKDKDGYKYKWMYDDLTRILAHGYARDAEDFIYTIADIGEQIIKEREYSEEFDKLRQSKKPKHILYLANKEDCYCIDKRRYNLFSCKNGKLNNDRNIIGDRFIYEIDYENISNYVNIQSLDLIFVSPF